MSMVGPDPLAIDCAIHGRLGTETAAARLQAFAKSTKVTVGEKPLRLSYAGPDLSHHAADPDLWAADFRRPLEDCDLSDADYADFRACLPEFDLCLEDSWSGYLVASRLLAGRDTAEALVLIHLDDHTDMMPTLLSLNGNGLRDPSASRDFHPADPAHWLTAIRSGAISIGSWLTALYYLKQPVHVRHLTHGANCVDDGAHTVVPGIATTRLLPNIRFAAVKRQALEAPAALGTYRSGPDAFELLKHLPRGRVMVHVDLDYFINDYNGNVGAQPPLAVAEIRKRGRARLHAFVDAMTQHAIRAEHWLVGMSPGFCSARHWSMLLAGLVEAIPALRDPGT